MTDITLDKALERAAERALQGVRNGFKIGLGSGSAVSRFVEVLGNSGLEVSVVPSSLQITIKAEVEGLAIAQPSIIPELDLDVDGADQIDSRLRMIKGGGGALLKEKVLMNASKKRVIIADELKFVQYLDKPVPVETVPYARSSVAKDLGSLGGKPRLRSLDKGYPFLTENGNIILDTDFGKLDRPRELNQQIKLIPGVAESGLFAERVDIAFKARTDGTVDEIKFHS